MESLNIKVYIGILSEDKLYDQTYIKVFINMMLPFFKGKLRDYTGDETVNIVNDNTGSSEKITVKTSNIITAKYLGLFSNRTIPPDLRKGEQVIVFRIADDDDYYWIQTSQDDNLRRLETLRLHVSDLKDPVKKLNEDNMYYIELDTLRGKSIVLRTAKTNEEEFRYIFKIDADKNIVTLEDDSGNTIEIDSNDPKITIIDRNQAFVILDKDDIFIQNHDLSFITLIKNIITAKNIDGSMIEINGGDIKALNPAGCIVSMIGPDITIHATNTLTLNATAPVTLNGGGTLALNMVGDTSMVATGNISVLSDKIINVHGKKVNITED